MSSLVAKLQNSLGTSSRQEIFFNLSRSADSSIHDSPAVAAHPCTCNHVPRSDNRSLARYFFISSDSQITSGRVNLDEQQKTSCIHQSTNLKSYITQKKAHVTLAIVLMCGLGAFIQLHTSAQTHSFTSGPLQLDQLSDYERALTVKTQCESLVGQLEQDAFVFKVQLPLFACIIYLFYFTRIFNSKWTSSFSCFSTLFQLISFFCFISSTTFCSFFPPAHFRNFVSGFYCLLSQKLIRTYVINSSSL